MKTHPKKIPRNFRLDSEIEAELKRRSKLTGITETRILEDALQFFFDERMQANIAAIAKKLKEKRNTHSGGSGTTMPQFSNSILATAA